MGGMKSGPQTKGSSVIGSGSGFRLFRAQGRFGVDVDVSEMRSRCHYDLIIGVHDQTDSAVFNGNAVKRLLETDQSSAERAFLTENAEIVQIRNAEQRGVLRNERASRFFGRARKRFAREIVNHVGRAAEIVPAGTHIRSVRRRFQIFERGVLFARCAAQILQIA